MDNAEWLAQTPEDAIDPALPICDPHHHLWDFPTSRYLLEDIAADVDAGHNVTSTVFVECTSMYREGGPDAMKPVGETEFVEAVAARSASGQYGPRGVAAGIVSYADLTLGGAVEEVLDAHIAASPNRFRGIRHASAWDASNDVRNSHTKPPRGLLRDARFREGFGCLEKLGLSFDAWLYHTQIDDVTDLAQAFPGTTIVMDHVGGPLGIGPYQGRRDAVFADWKMAIDRLAACPNVVVKLGGLAMKINGFDWHKRARPPGSEELAAAIAPYLLHCIERFGPARGMFESNFPVDKASCSYVVLWNAFKRVTESFSATDRAALFHDTAARVYRL